MPPIDIKDILNSKVNAPREEANAKDWDFKPAPSGMSVTAKTLLRKDILSKWTNILTNA